MIQNLAGTWSTAQLIRLEATWVPDSLSHIGNHNENENQKENCASSRK